MVPMQITPNQRFGHPAWGMIEVARHSIVSKRSPTICEQPADRRRDSVPA